MEAKETRYIRMMPHECSCLTTGQTFAFAFTAAVSLRLDTLPDTMSGTMVIPSMSSLNKIHTHTPSKATSCGMMRGSFAWRQEAKRTGIE